MIFALLSLVAAQDGFLTEYISPLQQAYDPNLSNSFFHYTKIVICSLNDITTWNCGHYCQLHPGVVDVKAWYNPDHSSQAFCGYNPNENKILLVYRSTQDITNWINNIKFFKHDFGDCSNCQVHLGFWETYTDLSANMIQCARDLKQKHPKGEFLIAGHSLGGAIAALMAVDVTRLGYKVDHFYTYGAPRIGNPEFFAWFKSYVKPTNHWRVTHYQDTVVHQPPQSFNYDHLPQEVWYDRPFTSFKICNDDQKEDSSCANSQWAFSTADHTSYFNEVNQCRTTLEESLEMQNTDQIIIYE